MTAALDVVRRLRAAGYETYFAGGCVRDRLLGRAPLDYDVATAAPPEVVQRLFPRTVPVGAQFGVVLVLHGGGRFEVATFRSADAYVDGRRPSRVHFGSAREDAERRDFTINALFWDPLEDRIIDFVGGEADLRAGVIRAIGDAAARIAEDRLRMLRAVRFAARFGFTIEPATQAAVVAAAPTLVDIAGERIGEEIVKLLTEGGARRGFELLAATGLLDVVLPEVARLRGVAQSPDFHPEGDVFTHTLLLLQQLPAGCRRRSLLARSSTTSASPRARAPTTAGSPFTATPRSAPRSPSRSASACGGAARSGSAWQRSSGITCGSSRRRRCAARRSSGCSRGRTSRSSSGSPGSMPSPRTAISARCSSASGDARSSRRRACAHRGFSAATT